MARRGLLRQVQYPAGPVPSDVAVDAQNAARDALERLTADDDLVQAPALSLAASSAIPTSATVVIYRGSATQTLTLPPAAGRGANVGAVVYLLNASASAVTLARGGVDTVNGATALSLAAGKLAILVSDGVKLWQAVTS